MHGNGLEPAARIDSELCSFCGSPMELQGESSCATIWKCSRCATVRAVARGKGFGAKAAAEVQQLRTHSFEIS